MEQQCGQKFATEMQSRLASHTYSGYPHAYSKICKSTLIILLSNFFFHTSFRVPMLYPFTLIGLISKFRIFNYNRPCVDIDDWARVWRLWKKKKQKWEPWIRFRES